MTESDTSLNEVQVGLNTAPKKEERSPKRTRGSGGNELGPEVAPGPPKWEKVLEIIGESIEKRKKFAAEVAEMDNEIAELMRHALLGN